MQTQYWHIHSEQYPDSAAIKEAAAFLRKGKTVAFPTETVYGLGADARSDSAVQRIFDAKGRPPDNPLIVHIADKKQLEQLTPSVSVEAERLIERFWPGPLTLVLPAKPHSVSDKVTAGLATVAVRMPNHPIALALIRASGCPLAAPSANRSGRPSPTAAAHVMDDLQGRIDGVLDGGPCGIGLESTVVECGEHGLTILRPGGISMEQLREVVPEVRLDEALNLHSNSNAVPRSPGMKYAHYAPKGRMIVVAGTSMERVREHIQHELNAAAERGERTGVLAFTEHMNWYEANAVLSYGSMHDPSKATQALYSALREFDAQGIEYIAAEGWPEKGLGLAVMNRLGKAAGGNVIIV